MLVTQMSFFSVHAHTESTHRIRPQQSSSMVQGFEASTQHRGVKSWNCGRQE
jgi:hypothetical protein